MMLRKAMLSVALLAVASAGEAATERDRWIKHLDKYAVRVGTEKVPTILEAVARAKSACVCAGEEGLSGRPGFVVFGENAGGFTTFCVVPGFDESGALEIAAGCATYVPLAK